MKMKFLSFFTALFICSYCWAQSIEGYWGGDLDIQGTKLSLYFDITESDNGYAAKLDVPQQGATGIKVTAISFDGTNLQMEMGSIPASFQGQVVPADGIINGTFSQNDINLPLKLSRTERIQLRRPQEPKAPFPYRQEEVRFTNESQGITLAGTLTIPNVKDKCPAVVLISGSGSQNRDEEMYSHKPFAVIADYLTRNGIAVLRYDDRGVGDSEKGKTNGTTLDLSYDAEAAVKFLKDKGCFGKIGVLGHSEGGLISFMLSERKLVDFVVSLAGPSVKGTEVILAQQDSLYRLQGVPQQAIDASKSLFKDFFLIIDNSDTENEARGKLEAMTEQLPKQVRDALMEQFLAPWMFYFCKYDPMKSIAATTCPVLILNGTKDMQVIASQNIPVYKKIEAKNPETNFEYHVLPGLNHLFQHCTTCAQSEYGEIEETISPEVLEIMRTFIIAQK